MHDDVERAIEALERVMQGSAAFNQMQMPVAYRSHIHTVINAAQALDKLVEGAGFDRIRVQQLQNSLASCENALEESHARELALTRPAPAATPLVGEAAAEPGELVIEAQSELKKCISMHDFASWTDDYAIKLINALASRVSTSVGGEAAGWVAVAERLPSEGEKVLIVGPFSKDMAVGSFDPNNGLPGWQIGWPHNALWSLKQYSLWHSIPTPPTHAS
jgi:hypothetical protein